MKTLLRLTLCGIALLSLHNNANAQKTLPAYIVTATSDTIQGQILKESESKRTFRIQFDAGSGLETYEAKNINAYGIGDSLRFEAKDVFVDEMQNRAFLKVIVDGPTKLYYSRNLNNDGQYYIQKPGEPTIQLRKTIYRSILSGILNDCEQMQIERGSALERNNAYSAKSLGQYVHSYNNCKHPEAASQTLIEEPKAKYTWGVLLGGHISNASSTNVEDVFRDYTINSSPGLTAGLLFNLDFGKKISVQHELLFTQRNLEMVHEYDNKIDRKYTVRRHAQANMLQVPIMLKYTIGNRHLQPYLLGGLTVGFTFNRESSSKLVYESGNEYEYDDNPLSKMMFGASVGAGLQQRVFNNHRLIMEARYSYDKANHSHGRVGPQFHNTTFLTGFIF